MALLERNLGEELSEGPMGVGDHQLVALEAVDEFGYEKSASSGLVCLVEVSPVLDERELILLRLVQGGHRPAEEVGRTDDLSLADKGSNLCQGHSKSGHLRASFFPSHKRHLDVPAELGWAHLIRSPVCEREAILEQVLV